MNKPAPALSTAALPATARGGQRIAAPVEIGPGVPQEVARSLYQTLKDKGFTPQQIVSVSSELIGLVTRELAPATRDLAS